MENLKIDTACVKEAGKIEQVIESFYCSAIEESAKEQNLGIYFALSHLNDEIFLTGKISGTIVLECSRCLESFAFPVEIQIDQVYPASTEVIDLNEELRELLILNLPGKPLCSKDCSGLCPACGKNLNNGRCKCTLSTGNLQWEKLKDLLK